MKANELVYEVQQTEKLLLQEIGEIISKRINQLSENTGLDIGYISIKTVETTAFCDPCKKYTASNVDIEFSLPGKVHGI